MDRGGARTLTPRSIAAISLAFLAITFGGVALAGANPPIRSARWVAGEADAASVLTHRPVECLPLRPWSDKALSIEVGRAAFRTPLLLGGQASRAGLSCDSCHRNGRANPSFFFPGLSGAPGTADVTSALFSTRRDDGIDNPKVIPDLGGPKNRLKIDQRHNDRALRSFIRGLVVDEFDGVEPPAAVLTGLATYVRALSPAVCQGRADEPLHAEQTITDTRRAVRAGLAVLKRHDVETAVFLVGAARSQLALLDERYAPPSLSADRARIKSAALDLATALADIRAANPRAQTDLTDWLARMPSWADTLRRDEARSLYARGPLLTALTAP